LFIDYLFNEKSALCILPEDFKKHHIDMIENMDNMSSNQQQPTTPPTIEQINQAIKVLAQVRYNT
jgi:hypothetical protein